VKRGNGEEGLRDLGTELQNIETEKRGRRTEGLGTWGQNSKILKRRNGEEGLRGLGDLGTELQNIETEKR